MVWDGWGAPGNPFRSSSIVLFDFFSSGYGFPRHVDCMYSSTWLMVYGEMAGNMCFPKNDVGALQSCISRDILFEAARRPARVGKEDASIQSIMDFEKLRRVPGFQCIVAKKWLCESYGHLSDSKDQNRKSTKSQRSQVLGLRRAQIPQNDNQSHPKETPADSILPKLESSLHQVWYGEYTAAMHQPKRTQNPLSQL